MCSLLNNAGTDCLYHLPDTLVPTNWLNSLSGLSQPIPPGPPNPTPPSFPHPLTHSISAPISLPSTHTLQSSSVKCFTFDLKNPDDEVKATTWTMIYLCDVKVQNKFCYVPFKLYYICVSALLKNILSKLIYIYIVSHSTLDFLFSY